MASSVCSLRRVLHPSSTCLGSLPSIFARNRHVAASEGFLACGDVAAKGSPNSRTAGPEDKRAEKDSRPINFWAPDPVTGYYRPIDQATEAQENALKKK